MSAARSGNEAPQILQTSPRTLVVLVAGTDAALGVGFRFRRCAVLRTVLLTTALVDLLGLRVAAEAFVTGPAAAVRARACA